MTQMLIRILDFFAAVLGLSILSPMLLVILIVGFFDTGSPLFFQQRVGRYKKAFTLVKFRTMRVDTPSAASHLVGSNSITAMGKFLRRSKLDELPQLWNVLLGDMSLVGPRPCLFSQQELIEVRDRLGVYNVRPGITGLAQLSGIDMSTPDLLAKIDCQMVQSLSLKSYFKYIVQTIAGRGAGDAVR